jgi:hypothetical protein
VVHLPDLPGGLPETAGLAGSAPGAAQVGFRENGVFLGAAAVAADGRWAWDPGWAWARGAHHVEVVAVDAAGGQSPAVAVSFTVVGTPAGAGPAAY